MNRPHRPILHLQIALLSAISTLTCSEDPAREKKVVARIDGEPILQSEIEARAAWRLYRARFDAHHVLALETAKVIEERLLERIAQERGVEPEALLRRVESEAAPVSEADITDYLEEHPSDVPAKKARARIRYFLEERRRIERRLAFLEDLENEAEIEILLKPPPRPRQPLDLSGAPSRGPTAAPITIVHFADLSRRESAQSAHQIAELQAEYPEKIRVLHRNLPAERDELALHTAQLAFAAQRMGGFWRFHDRLVASGGVRQKMDLEAMIRELDLSDALTTPAAEQAALRSVRRDLEHAEAAGVRRAPTTFVNGRYLMPLESAQALGALVREELESLE